MHESHICLHMAVHEGGLVWIMKYNMTTKRKVWMPLSRRIRLYMLVIKTAADDINFQRCIHGPFYSLPITNRSENGSS
jgi:hypothetical protein